MSLIGCSNVPHDRELNLTIERTKTVHPPLPEPMKLKDEKFVACENGTMVCMTPEDAKVIPQNKKEMGRWSSEIMGVVRYYRGQD